MRVLFLQQQPCIRTLKYAVGLRRACPDIVLGFACHGQSLSQWYGTGDEAFDRWWQLPGEPRAELSRLVTEFRPDVIHSHNLPDRLTVLALEVAEGAIPVIHDAHDLQSLRHTPYEDGFPEPADSLALEKVAVEGSTAVVTVSEEMLEEICARHRPPPRRCSFPNYALERHMPATLPPAERPRSDRPRIVYQGTLSTNGGHYDLRALFQAIVAGGGLLDIYPARAAPAYEALAAQAPGMSCLEKLEPRHLLQVLPQYDFGWAGFNSALNGAHVDVALPNKVFEYLACGLPVLTLGHRAITRFLTHKGTGVSLSTLEDLDDQLGEVDLVALRQQVAGVRSDLTVEANIHMVTELYDAVTS